MGVWRVEYTVNNPINPTGGDAGRADFARCYNSFQRRATNLPDAGRTQFPSLVSSAFLRLRSSLLSIPRRSAKIEPPHVWLDFNRLTPKGVPPSACRDADRSDLTRNSVSPFLPPTPAQQRFASPRLDGYRSRATSPVVTGPTRSPAVPLPYPLSPRSVPTSPLPGQTQ